MSADNTQGAAIVAPGNPNINIRLNSGIRGERVEALPTDSNQISVEGEQRWHWLESIAMPARPADIALQVGAVLCLGAFGASVVKAFPSEITLTIGVIVVVLIAAIALVVAHRYPRAEIYIHLQLFLLILGCIVGGLL